MGTLLNALNWLDGKKSYMVGAATILTGAAGLLTELANASGMLGYLSFVQHAASDPNWLMILAGCGVIAGKSAVAKVAAAVSAPSA